MTLEQSTHEVVVIGAGLSGVYALLQLRKEGFDAIALESGPSVGGTWYWNCYPGARVDIESIEFSFSFDPELQQDWTWSTRYAGQPELLRYLEHVVERYDLASHIALSTHVASARFDDDTSTWTVISKDGRTFVANHVVMAGGALSTQKEPLIKGLSTFRGDLLRSSRWPTEGYDLSDKRVGVIGTGSSGVQIISAIAPDVGENLYVFQRTAPFIVPAHNEPLSAEFINDVKKDYDLWRKAEHEHFGGFVAVDYQIGSSPAVTTMEATPEEREAEFEKRWHAGGLSFYSSFGDLLFNEESNAELAKFLQRKTREQVAGHPDEEAFIPKDYMPLTRRLIVDDAYYEAYTAHGAHLVDIRDKDIEVTEIGVRVDGVDYELDALVLATGFEAVVGAPTSMEILGSGRANLKDTWQQRPSTFIGYMVSGFPNMYLINGAGCPGALTQAFTLSEFQSEWVRDLLVYARGHGHRRIEASPQAQEAWTTHLADVLNMTLFPRSASWYMGTNVEGRQPMPMLYLGGFPAYKRHSLEQRDGHYPDLAFDGDKTRLREEPVFTL